LGVEFSHFLVDPDGAECQFGWVNLSSLRDYFMSRVRGIKLLVVIIFLSSVGLSRADDAPPQGDALHLRTGKVVLDANRSLHKTVESSRSGHYIIQLNGPLTPPRKSALADAGIVLGQYLPMNSYIVQLPEGYRLQEKLRDLDFVRWVGDFDKRWKIDTNIGRAQLGTEKRINLANEGKVKLTVKLFEGQNLDAVVTLVKGIPGAKVTDVSPRADGGLIEVNIPLGAQSSLADVDEIQWVEEAPEITERNDTNKWILQSNVLDSTPIWDHGITGMGQIGGHIDNTLNPSHCAFRDPSGNPIGPTHRKILAYNGTQGYSAHGTFTGGIFVGDAVPAGGTTQYRGMAYDAKMVCTRLNTVTAVNLLSILNTAQTQGARVHTNSWGTDFTQVYNQQVADVDNFSYTNEDNLVLFAATNQNSVVYTPENAKNCVAVCGTQDTPSQENWCVGGHAPTIDGRRKPDVMAPACGTISALGSGTSCTFGTSGSGTSYACPAVAGAAILIRQYFMDGFYPTGEVHTPHPLLKRQQFSRPSGALIKATLINSAINMTGVLGYPSDTEGWGRVLLDNALYFQGEDRKLIVDDIRNASGLSTGESRSYSVQVNSGGLPLKAVLVWTDPPAAVSSNPNYINDLNLEMTDSANNTYLGNVFDTAVGQSITGGTADFRNNVEVVLLNTPPAGQYSIQVKGAAVNVGTQGFAIVITGDISPALSALSADCDGNGVFDLDLDTACFVNVLLEKSSSLSAVSRSDINLDGSIDAADIQAFVECAKLAGR
jgi:hypothetical protein